jgi:hypothetical protein
MEAFRKGLFKYLEKDKLNRMVEKQLSQIQLFRIDELNWDFPISCDIDPPNAERRKLLYLKRRDLVLKLARESLPKSGLLERFTRQEDAGLGNHFLHFDMVRNTYNE